MDIDTIRWLWQNEEVKFSDEVDNRMAQREVSLANIEQAITNGRIIEERPGYPHPKCTVQGWAEREVAGLTIGLWGLNVVCAVGDRLYLITVYWEK